jgi:hypothetical protein
MNTRSLQEPRALLVLKDGHVGSEWFAEAVSRQPATRFIFEMGPCITGSLAGKRAFLQDKRGCACTKEDCTLFRRDGDRAPCLDQPSARKCKILGGSHLSMTSEKEMAQWEQVLSNSSGVTVLVQTRSNLVKWAWSFYRTGAMHRVRTRTNSSERQMSVPLPKEQIHVRNASNRVRHKLLVDPALLLRMILSKQQRSERLLSTARRFAELVGQRRERVLLYEAMQADLEKELQSLFVHMDAPFDVAAHRREKEGALLKTTSDDLSNVITNWDEVRAAYSGHPCLLQMLTDTDRRIFDYCGEGIHGGTCDCSWRTPIELAADGTNFPSHAALIAATTPSTSRRQSHVQMQLNLQQASPAKDVLTMLLSASKISVPSAFLLFLTGTLFGACLMLCTNPFALPWLQVWKTKSTQQVVCKRDAQK